ncbi:MAG: hypothetical protein RBT61_07565 [Candidatus Kapabacteria bacterium]|jgi:hypothetical protein|nr:hypothetical protein [Candidatus Kapabacteria bacterium]
MFEKQINDEFDRLFANFENRNTKFDEIIGQLSDDNFYVNFFIAESRFNCFKILTQLSAESVYPDDLYLNSQSLESFKLFHDSYNMIEYSHLSKLLRYAVEIKYNYTIRPLTTLISFIFSDSVSISITEAEYKAAYFTGNDFILDLAKGILRDTDKSRPDKIITRAEFTNNLLLEIKEHVSKLQPNEIVKLTNALFKLIPSQNAYTLLLLALMIFFDDIKMRALVALLDESRDSNLPIDESMLEYMIIKIKDENNYTIQNEGEVENNEHDENRHPSNPTSEYDTDEMNDSTYTLNSEIPVDNSTLSDNNNEETVNDIEENASSDIAPIEEQSAELNTTKIVELKDAINQLLSDIDSEIH